MTSWTEAVDVISGLGPRLITSSRAWLRDRPWPGSYVRGGRSGLRCDGSLSGVRTCGRSPDCVPPFSARGAAVRFYRRGVDQHLSRCAAGRRKRMEDVEPYPFGRPAYEAVVKRLARAVDDRRIRPTATGLQHMHDAADDAAIIHSRFTASVGRQMRRKPRELTIVQP